MTMIKAQFLLLSSILKTRLDGVYPNVFIAPRNTLNCSNTVASAEMSFSKLKLIKTFNRSHMTNNRLSPLAMLSMETSWVRSPGLEEVVKQWFSTCHSLWPPSLPKSPNTSGPLLINRVLQYHDRAF